MEYEAALGRLARGRPSDGASSSWTGCALRRATPRTAVETAASVYRTVRPINQTASPIMRSRRMLRELGVHEVPLSTLKEAAHRAGGTLNDGFLAGVTGGLRRYHAEHGAEVGELNVTMPVNVRTEDDPVGGNRITLMRFPLPVGMVDPAERIAEIHVAGRRRASRAVPAVHPGHRRRAQPAAALVHRRDPAARGLPGQQRHRPAGAGVRRRRAVRMQYAFGPTIGSGVNVTLLSYVDTCAIGINVDTGAVPDVDAAPRVPGRGVRRGAGARRLTPSRPRHAARRPARAKRPARPRTPTDDWSDHDPDRPEKRPAPARPLGGLPDEQLRAVDAVVDRAAAAAEEFRALDQEQVDPIVEAMVRAGVRAAPELAPWPSRRPGSASSRTRSSRTTSRPSSSTTTCATSGRSA